MYLFGNVYYILIAAAIIPAVVLMIRVYRADKIEKEPVGLLLSLVLYGVLATAFAMLTETVASKILSGYYEENTIAYNAIMYFGIVAFSEEGFKYILLKKRTWKCPSFNCLYDGVVYAVFVSLGFAMWENVGYVLRYGFTTAIVRAITAVPGHACFGVFMGVWYSLAKKYENYGNHVKSKTCRVMAVIIPVAMHGCYDFVASMKMQYQTLIFAVFIVVMFFIAFRLVKKISSSDRYIN